MTVTQIKRSLNRIKEPASDTRILQSIEMLWASSRIQIHVSITRLSAPATDTYASPPTCGFARMCKFFSKSKPYNREAYTSLVIPYLHLCSSDILHNLNSHSAHQLWCTQATYNLLKEFTRNHITNICFEMLAKLNSKCCMEIKHILIINF